MVSGIIYCIKSKETGEQYIGSTTIDLKVRLQCHWRSLTYGSNCSSTKILAYGPDNVEVSVLEQFEDIEESELRKKEGEYIRKSNNCVNIVVPGRTREEYYKDNAEVYRESRKQYYEANKEQFSERWKKYYNDHKEELNKKNHDYHVANKTVRNEVSRQYYNEHREEINAKRNAKVPCEICGAIRSKASLTQHRKRIHGIEPRKNHDKR